MKKILLTLIVAIIAIAISYSIGSRLLYAYVFPEAAPVQPIAFSHKLHAGDNKIPCQFCHIYARRSRVAGIPSVQRCMGCHKTIRTDSPEIQKIHTAWQNKKSIRWAKVYDLPDYIYFPHKRHVSANVKCQECHGPVETMEVIKKQSSLGMGWCLSCHQKRNGPTDCWECHI